MAARSRAGWRAALAAGIKRAARWADVQVERRWRPLSRRLGRETAGSLIAYCGWASESGISGGGRVLANRPPAEAADGAGWWHNLRDTYRRWETDEVPGVSVEARFGGQCQRLQSDAEGYLQFKLPCTAPLPGGYWQQARLRVVSAPGGRRVPQIESDCPIINPGPDAQFGVISDLDDTVIQTGVTNLLTAARLTFLGNARTRKPLEGVAALYRVLHGGCADAAAPPRNPIFYVSSSGWNLYDLLDGFIKFNDIPSGPILLQDLGVDERKFVTGGHGHKLEKARCILADFPRLPFILFGDSGQHDAELYAQLAEEQPQRVRAILIHDVDPAKASARDDKVRAQIRRAEAVGVPMWLVSDSLSAAHHLRDLGLLPVQALPLIERERDADERRK